MYKLLIVEDERLPRRALRAMIEKGYPQIGQIKEAEDGDEALQTARAWHPDILLVDINIPGLSGLELCRALVGEGLAGNTIITTAYGRFGYVKEAMDLGCQGYLLKPIREKELEQAMQKCFSAIEERRHTARTFEGLESMKDYAGPYLMQEFAQKGIRPDLLKKGYGWQENGCLSAFYLIWESQEEKQALSQTLPIWSEALNFNFDVIADASDGGVQILLHEKKSGLNQPVLTALWLGASAAAARIRREKNMTGRLRMAGPFQTYQQLNEAFQREIKLKPVPSVCGQTYLEPGCFFKRDGLPKAKRAVIRQKIIQRFREGNFERAAAVLHRLGKEYPEQKIQILMEALWNFAPDLELISVWRQLPDMMPGVTGISRWLCRIWEEHVGASEQTEQTDPVDTALRIVKTRYAEPISEAEVAEEVGLSQAYFSRLFKQRTGENFSSALAGIRLECARALMDQGVWDLNEIAGKSGFVSGRYLDTVFKQTYGYSAAQYRRRKEREET